jgi:hypothetical protein
MNTEIIRKFKWFWAWQDEKEEAWLSEMAEKGFHLEKVCLPGQYTFKVGEPEKYAYRLDYQPLRRADRESYLQLFKDAGWEHVGDMSNWVYFRKKASAGETPEIFSDTDSKITKYQRIILYLVIFLPILIILKPDAGDPPRANLLIMEGFFLLLIVLYSIVMIQLIRRITQLKKKQ